MSHHTMTTGRQSLFTAVSGTEENDCATDFPPVAQAPRALCRVCGRAPARLSVARRRRSPVELCLRCHHAVMMQRRPRKVERSIGSARPSLAARLSSSTLPAIPSLIVPRGPGFWRQAKYADLSHRRRRAQVAARHALETASVGRHQELRAS